jgi:hypothetical protein
MLQLQHLESRLNNIQRVLKIERDWYFTNNQPNYFLVEFASLSGHNLKEIEQFADILVIEPTKKKTLRMLIEVRSA